MDRANILQDTICGERIMSLRRGHERKTKRISQEKLATMFRTANSKISRDIIEDIESGERDIFDIEIVWFAKILDTTVEYLTGISNNYETRFDEHDTEIDDSMKDRVNICGKWLRKARKQFPGKMSQQTLSSRMREHGFDFKYYSILQIEKGARRVRLSEMRAFAEILGIPLMFLFKGDNRKLPNIESFESYAAQDD